MSAVTQKQEYDLTDLVQTHQAGVWRYLRFVGADANEAEDLVQETFLAFMRANFVYHGPAATAAYLRQVARRQLLLARRKQGREVNTVELNAADSVWSDSVSDDGLDDYLGALRDCLESLQTRSCTAISLQYQQGLGRAEIADQLGMTLDGIKTLMRRTRQSLRECVERKVRQT